MSKEERILVSLLIYGGSSPTGWQDILYDLVTDLGIENLGTVLAGVDEIVAHQRIYKEFCLGCLSYTGLLSPELVPVCSSCSQEQRDLGLYHQYFLNFIFGVEREGLQRRALHQIVYSSGLLPEPTQSKYTYDT